MRCSPEWEPGHFLPTALAASKTKGCLQNLRHVSARDYLSKEIQGEDRPAASSLFLLPEPWSLGNAHSECNQNIQRNPLPAWPTQKAGKTRGVLHNRSNFPLRKATMEKREGFAFPEPGAQIRLRLDTKPQFSLHAAFEQSRQFSLPPNRTICRKLCNCPARS